MISKRIQQLYVMFLMIVALTYGLTGCQPASYQENQVTSAPTKNQVGSMEKPTEISDIQSRSTISPATQEPLPTSTPTATLTPAPLPTATSSPTPTPTIKPTPPAPDVPCKNTGGLPGQAFPDQIDMSGSHNQRVAIAYPLLYLAVEQYIGIFNIANPAAPQFLGFWGFPDWPHISTLQVQNGVAYFTNESTVILLNLSAKCQFETITKIDIPFKIFQLEVQGNRLYIDETSLADQENQVVIFSIVEPNSLEQLGIIDLRQVATWSVLEENLYALGDELMNIDVADPSQPEYQPVNLPLDTEKLAYSPSIWKDDRLYLLWEAQTLTIVSELQEKEPTVIRNDDRQIIMGDLNHFAFQVSENYIFLGGYTCDGGSCGSYVSFFDATNGQELSGLGIPDHQSPVHSYYEIEPNIIYAFTDDSLLVIDITNQEKPIIIDEVPMLS